MQEVTRHGDQKEYETKLFMLLFIWIICFEKVVCRLILISVEDNNLSPYITF